MRWILSIQNKNNNSKRLQSVHFVSGFTFVPLVLSYEHNVAQKLGTDLDVIC